MSITASQLITEISVDGLEKAQADLNSMGASVDRAGGIFRAGLGGALSLATGLAGKAFQFLSAQIYDSIGIAEKHEEVMAQTAQVIKSTGGIAGMTTQSVADLADSLSHVTKFSEDTIESGENLLLTFTGIGKEVFPEATQAMLDLSQATGEDMKSASIQLGKALNDPLQGLNALARVGVSFSAQEKAQIQTMMAHNDIMGAQKVMLHELEVEFGGSAQAAGKTFAGSLQILKNNLEDIKEKIGAAILPLLVTFTSYISSRILPLLESFAGWFTKLINPTGRWMELLHEIVRYLVSFDLRPIVYQWDHLVAAFVQASKPLDATRLAMTNLLPGFVMLRDLLAQNVTKAVAGFADILSNVRLPVAVLAASLRELLRQFSYLFGVIQTIGLDLLRHFSDSVHGVSDVISGVLRAALFALDDALIQAGYYVHHLANFLAELNFSALAERARAFGAVIKAHVSKTLEGLEPLLSRIKQKLLEFAGEVASINFGGAETHLAAFGGALRTHVEQILQELQPYFEQLKGKVQQFAAQLAGINWKGVMADAKALGGVLLTSVIQSFKDVEPVAKRLAGLMRDELTREFNDLKGAAKDLGFWFVTSVIPAIKQALPGFLSLGQVLFTDVLPAMIELRGIVADVVEHGFQTFVPILERIIPQLIVVSGVIAGGLAAALKFLLPYALQAAHAVGDFANELMDRVAPIVYNVMDGITMSVRAFAKIWQQNWFWMEGVLKGVWDIIVGLIKIAWATFSGIIKIGLDILAGNWRQAWVDFQTMLRDAWAGIEQTARGQWEVMYGIFKLAHTTITNIFQDIGLWFDDRWYEITDGFTSIVGGLGDDATSIFDTVTANVRASLNNVIDLVNQAISGINQINVAGVSPNIPLIPHLARGTDFAPGGLSLIGEEGPELMYIPRGAQVIPSNKLGNVFAGTGSAGQGSPLVINLDGYRLAMALMPYIVNNIRAGVGTHGM